MIELPWRMSIDRSTQKGSDETLAMADKGAEWRRVEKMRRRRPRVVRSDDLWAYAMGTKGNAWGTCSTWQVFAVMQSNLILFGTFVYENA